ncbi:MAG: hypothetical protein NT115_13265 [Proteobacteria bacterium]|nr:hypothetical protein [Pseudomonadota bacterium]
MPGDEIGYFPQINGDKQLYQQEIDKNIKFASMGVDEKEASILRRTPAETLPV